MKAGALAISEGHIAPINPMDEEKTQVYVYNNIFYSRAVDTKENFKVRFMKILFTLMKKIVKHWSSKTVICFCLFFNVIIGYSKCII